jgi:EAL domain-containing protein (putative c-di-GMP-specific phosphodiesterase class I)
MCKETSANVLIRAVIALTHQLGMKVGAVGVEEDWQAKMLRGQGCDAMQGAYMTQPIPAKQLGEWLEKNRI